MMHFMLEKNFIVATHSIILTRLPTLIIWSFTEKKKSLLTAMMAFRSGDIVVVVDCRCHCSYHTNLLV